MDRAFDFESKGCRFEPCWAYYLLKKPLSLAVFFLWQLAHLTTHKSISLFNASIDEPRPIMTDTSLFFSPVT